MAGEEFRARAGNWWHYHKFAALLIALCLIAALVLLRGLFDRREPDLVIGCVTTEALPPEAAQALTEALTRLCGDVNGDGEALVELEQFALDFRAGGDYREMDERMAAITRMTGSIYAADGAGIFLLDDPEGFQRRTGALQYLDGHLPAAEANYEAANWREMSIPWNTSALSKEKEFSNLRAGFPILESLYLTQTAPSPRDSESRAAATQELWDKIK